MKQSLPDNGLGVLLQCIKHLLSNFPTELDIPCNADWPSVIALAERHGVSGILYQSLKQYGKDKLAGENWERIKKIYFNNSARNLHLSSSLLKIINLLEINKITAVTFKGPIQSQILYQDIGMRTFSDIDILVEKKHAVPSLKILLENGFSNRVPIPASQLTEYLENEYFFELEDASGGIIVDLHWEMTGRYNLEPLYFPHKQDIFQIQFLGKTINTLNHEDMLIQLCIHGTKHCWNKLEYICSIAKAINSGMISDWDQFIARSKRLRCKRMVMLAILLSQKCFNVKMPVNIKSVINKDIRLKRIADDILDKMGLREIALEESFGRRFSLVHVAIRDSAWDRAKYAIYLLTTPTNKEWYFYPLPSWLLPLYHIIRPIRLIAAFLSVKKIGVIKENRGIQRE